MRLPLILLGLLFAAQASATVVMYDDRAAFEAATGATDVGDLPRTGGGATFSVGPLTFSSALPTRTTTQVSWSTIIDEDYDLAISGRENFDVASSERLTAFGFDFHEPTNTNPPGPTFPDNCNTPTCVESTFQIRLFLDGAFVDFGLFERPNDQLTFVGIQSSSQFNQIQVREIIGNADNEFFGNFTVATAVPAPSMLVLMLLGLLGVAAKRSR